MRLFGRAFLLAYICYEAKLCAVFDINLLISIFALWVISAANVSQNALVKSAFGITFVLEDGINSQYYSLELFYLRSYISPVGT
jgi:hypothetical protein